MIFLFDEQVNNYYIAVLYKVYEAAFIFFPKTKGDENNETSISGKTIGC
jgi:hypothetical protein